MMREETQIALCFSKFTTNGSEDGIQNLPTKKMSSTNQEKKELKDDSVEEESEWEFHNRKENGAATKA